MVLVRLVQRLTGGILGQIISSFVMRVVYDIRNLSVIVMHVVMFLEKKIKARLVVLSALLLGPTSHHRGEPCFKDLKVFRRLCYILLFLYLNYLLNLLSQH